MSELDYFFDQSLKNIHNVKFNDENNNINKIVTLTPWESVDNENIDLFALYTSYIYNI